MSAIHSFPNELLELIFDFGVAMQPDRSAAIPLNLYTPSSDVNASFADSISAVSRRWRQIALQTPRLWSRLYISRRGHESQASTGSASGACINAAPCGLGLEWIDVYLRRSGMHPLFITLECKNLPLHKVVPHLLVHSSRWRSLTIIVSHVGNLPAVLPHFSAASAPALEYLEVAGDIYREGIVSPTPIPSFFNGGAPKLVYLKLDRVYLGWKGTPLIGLTTLELKLTTWWPNFEGLQKMFTSSPMLKRLVVHDDISAVLRSVNPPVYLFGLPTVSIPHLQELELCVDQVSGGSRSPMLRYNHRLDDAVTKFISLLSIPSLESLALRNLTSMDWRKIVAHFKSSYDGYPHLRSLSLSDIKGDIAPHPHILEAFHRLTHLSLTRMRSNAFLELLLEDDSLGARGTPDSPELSLPHWPHMHSLAIRDDAKCNPSLLQTVVLCREGLSRPAMTLKLGEDLFEDIDLIAWLRKRSTVLHAE